MVPWHMKNQIIKKAGTLPSGLGRDIGVTLPSLIPVQLSAYDLISSFPHFRRLKGWRMRWSSQDSIVQLNIYMIYCK